MQLPLPFITEITLQKRCTQLLNSCPSLILQNKIADIISKPHLYLSGDKSLLLEILEILRKDISVLFEWKMEEIDLLIKTARRKK
jgi:hypothetical protein